MANDNFHSSGTKQKIDQAIDILYAGGVNNPMDAIEQISYLLFLKILTEKDKGRSAISKKYASPFKESFKKCSWDYLIPLSGNELVKSIRDAIEKIHELPEMSQTGKMLFSKATLKIMDSPTLKAVMGVIDSLSSELIAESDVKGDAYEYLLKKLSASGTNGQFRTPRHIIDFIVKLVDPKVGDTICDPACGTGGFLISAYNHILETNTTTEAKQINPPAYGDLLKPKQWDFLDEKAIWGLDNDTNMVKIAALNFYLHRLPKAKIAYHNTLTTSLAGGYSNQKFSVILANPPFAGKVQQESVQEDLCSGFNSRATELLFLKWIIDHLENGGRAGVIVPNGMLFGSTKAHQSIRQTLLEKCDLSGVINLPSGVFKPYSGVATSILIFEKGKSTKNVCFYEMKADGYSLDDKRSIVTENDIPDILKAWKSNKATSEWHFSVPVKDIANANFSLAMNLYKKSASKTNTGNTFQPPNVLLEELHLLQSSIASGLTSLSKRISI
jgi:type I restriction enzyme M protein